MSVHTQLILSLPITFDGMYEIRRSSSRNFRHHVLTSSKIILGPNVLITLFSSLYQRCSCRIWHQVSHSYKISVTYHSYQYNGAKKDSQLNDNKQWTSLIRLNSIMNIIFNLLLSFSSTWTLTYTGIYHHLSLYYECGLYYSKETWKYSEPIQNDFRCQVL
jgi:hypothetical protein